MRILLTGATGYIGKKLFNRLLVENHDVYILLRKSSKNDFCPKEKVLFVENLTSDLYSEYKFDGVIHLATLYINAHNSNDIDALISSNILLGTKILEFSVKSNVSWFINTGTLFQNYHNKTYNPVNLYAATKQAFQTIAEFYIQSSSIKFITLKLNDTFGPNDSRRKIFNIWKEILNTDEVLKMGPGDQIIQTLYITDVINGFIQLIRLIQGDVSNLKNEYALYSDSNYSLKEIAEIFELVSGKKLNIIWGALPYREREVLIPASCVEILPDWKPSVTLTDGISNLLNY